MHERNIQTKVILKQHIPLQNKEFVTCIPVTGTDHAGQVVFTIVNPRAEAFEHSKLKNIRIFLQIALDGLRNW